MNVPLHDPNYPVVAILTVEDDGKPYFKGNKENFIDFIRMGLQKNVFIYVVTTKDLKFYNRKIYGYYYSFQDEEWQRRQVPLPQVIYNRIPNRNDELSVQVQQKIQECLRHPYIRMFNPSFFNKWELFEWLSKAKRTKDFIPATKKLKQIDDLEGLLGKHSLLYLKPERGKAGSGIMRVSRNRSKLFKYRLSIQESKRSQSYKFPTTSKLWNKIEEQVRHEPYIIQQGIVLSHFCQRPYDLRTLVQKNGKGRWCLTGIGARVAGSASITTHVPRGGSIEPPRKLLTSTFSKGKARIILQRTKKAALAIAKQIERGCGYKLGEMSMDLGVDSAGHIWFFEANAKPMKFDEPEIRRKSLERLIQYSLHLIKERG